MIEVKIVIIGKMEKTLLTEKRHEKIFWNNGNFLFLDLGDGHMSVYICKKKHSDVYLGFVYLIICKLSLNKVLLQKRIYLAMLIDNIKKLYFYILERIRR